MLMGVGPTTFGYVAHAFLKTAIFVIADNHYGFVMKKVTQPFPF